MLRVQHGDFTRDVPRTFICCEVVIPEEPHPTSSVQLRNGDGPWLFARTGPSEKVEELFTRRGASEGVDVLGKRNGESALVGSSCIGLLKCSFQ